MTAEGYLRGVDAQCDRDLSTLERFRGVIAGESGSSGSPNAPMTTPEALRRPVPAAQRYPIEALGPTLGPACESLRRTVQAPDAICGASFLAGASLCAQAHGNVAIDGRIYPLSLWTLTVASSGERKSAVDSEVMRPIRAYEKTLSERLEPQLQKYQAATEEWQARKDALKKQHKSGVGLGAALEELGPPPEPPLAPMIVAADFTAEGLAKLLAVGQPSMGAFTDEAALVFGGHGMTKETVARTAATLSKLWDSGTLDRIRAGDGSMKLYGRRLSMHLMAQPVIVESALSNEVLLGQGFLARALLAWPESSMGTRLYVREDLRSDPALVRYQSRALALLTREFPLEPRTRNELAPPSLGLTEEASELWRQFHDVIEHGMGSRGLFSTVAAWASKTPEQAARVAGVLTLFDNPEARVIEAEAMDRAIELALWHLGEAVRLAGTAAVSREVRNAEALLTWAHEKRHSRLYSTLVLHTGPACIRENSTFRAAMAELERTGWVYRVDGGSVVDGKHRRHVWDIHPPIESNG